MAKQDKRIKYTSDTEKPEMISIRVPRELYAELAHLADQPGQTVTKLVVEGIRLRLGHTQPQERPGWNDGAPQGQIDGASIFRDMQATLERHETEMQTLMQAIKRQTPPVGNDRYEATSYGVIHCNTAIEPEGQEPASNLVSGDVPPFDTTKHHLGGLCKRGHDYGGSGQSLRNTDNQCLRCKAEDKQAKDARKRQAKAATP